jgi:hypothetical protein
MPLPQLLAIIRIGVFVRYFLPFLAIVMLVASCSRQQDDAVTTKSDARLAIGEVVRIAKQEAKRNDVDLKRYDEPMARYEVSREDGMWSVSFDKVGFSGPGSVFLVMVDDKTGEARFIPGR